MATSNTYDFNPAASDFVQNAYALCQVKRTELLQEHLVDARMHTNLMLSEWANRQVNLWTVDLVEVELEQGVKTYDVDPTTIAILDAYIRTEFDTANPVDRLIFSISRSDYAAMPNKEQQAPPTVFWFDRLIDPTITLWQVPDQDDTYRLRYYRCRQIQDTVLTNGRTVEIPYRWLDAFNWGLAARLAVIYAPNIAEALDARAERAWQFAAAQDTEKAPVYISPTLSSYYR